jgi:hypothetical protein
VRIAQRILPSLRATVRVNLPRGHALSVFPKIGARFERNKVELQVPFKLCVLVGGRLKLLKNVHCRGAKSLQVLSDGIKRRVYLAEIQFRLKII